MGNSQLEQLYLQYAEELFLYALSFTRNRHDAENLVSDAFFQLALQKEFPKKSKFWLFRVVKNRYIDQQRQQKRWGFLALEGFFLKGRNQTEEDFFQQESYRQLDQAIQHLEPPYKEIVVCYYFCNWSTQEIATFLQLSTNQVRVDLYRARQQLKEVLTHDGKY
ncbi:RNA polymerase sigma factor [Enterococcus nangangensis]|uniref:RNA polymerase sigma factor n=1 Tax=Enterococcus nangangensis TaxID=2559926 RepID=UPI0010F66E72|nr:sigma-70 family RNA polymerase sigma factor [Enterococcus nangangensis]